MGFGKPKYGSGAGKCPTWGLDMGDNIYRILPPMHSLAESGRWSNYVRTDWGYAGTDSQNPGKTRVKPFRCIQVENRRTGMVEEECPEDSLREGYKQRAQAREAELRAQHAALKPEEIDVIVDREMAPLRTWLRAHNQDAKHYLAVMNEKRIFGHLKINHTDKKKLDLKFDELRKNQAIDPLDLEQGVWVNFRRISKNGLDDIIDFVTEKVTATINGREVQVQQIIMAPLAADEVTRALEEVRDLTDVGGFILTHEQVLALTQAGEDPEEVDRIFAMNRKEKSTKAPAPAVALILDLADPRVQVRLAEIKARKDASLALPPAPASEAAYKLDDEAFLKLVGSTT